MGQIVAAMATCHSPALVLRQPGEDPAQLDATVDAMGQLGKVLDETKPDAVIIIGLDHLEAFPQECTPTFAVVVAPEVEGSFGHRKYRKPVHEDLARAIHEGCLKRDFDVALSQKAYMGHAFVVPFEYVLEQRDLPVVPFFVNVYLPPLPSPQRCYQLGRALAEVIAERGERVAIIASGGMSHYPGTDKYGEPEFEFDRMLLGILEGGEGSTLLNMSIEKLDEMGNTELLTWYTLLGAIGDQRANVLTYQPTWHHGLAVLDFPLATPLEGPPAARPMPTVTETAEGYKWYMPPRPESFNLNRLLFNLRMDPHERERLVSNMDEIMVEYELRPEEIEALKTLEPLAVAKAGGHPIASWVAVHMVKADLRKAEARASAST